MKTHTFVLIIETLFAARLSEGEVSAYLGLIKKEIKTDVLVCPQCSHCTRGENMRNFIMIIRNKYCSHI